MMNRVQRAHIFNAFDEVVNSDDMDDQTRMMGILTTLIGSQIIDEYKAMLPAALNFDVSPVQAIEIIYQAVAYLGIGRVFPFLQVTNDIFIAPGISLPLERRSTTTMDTRMEAGARTMVEIDGPLMEGFAQSGPEELRNIHRWLTANFFGDYYTRKGLDHKEREMITFCILLAQGGCEPQLVSHAIANMKVGNNKTFLIKVVSQCLPYIGYPRSQNALRCVEEACNQFKKQDGINIK